ncbi:MAG: ATP synthase F1 subunit delta [Pseudomonadota bacterium]
MSKYSNFSSKVSVVYARALFEISGVSLRDDFNKVSEMFRSDNMFSYKKMDSPLIDKEDKKRIIESSLREKCPDVFVEFLLLLVDKRRFHNVFEILDIYSYLCDESDGVISGDIRVPVVPDEKVSSTIKDIISKVTGKKVKPTFVADKNILAGFSTIIGLYYIDYSLSGHLEQLENEINRS